MDNKGNDSSELLQLAFDFVQYTNQHIFLTGKAGTGKTTFLHRLRRSSLKRMVVVAPTGVAAINAGGVTIHSFFQLGFGPILPGAAHSAAVEGNAASQAIHRFSRDKINIIRSLDLLVIDEVSMVRADLLDGIDSVLRRFRTRSKPFGGVQLLMIGDLHQLAPVIKEDEWKILQPYYENGFFFSSRALKETSYLSIELKHIFRQSDQRFIDILNQVRENRMDSQAWDELNKRYQPGFNPEEEEGYITLTTHNAQAQEINERKLAGIKGKQKSYQAMLTGEFPEYSYPTEKDLLLKTGAQVMFVKNDPGVEKKFYNGKIGRVTEIDEDHLLVQCPGEDEEITVEPLEWQNVKYTINEETKEITETVVGTFVQVPLKLAWAITIHKSQGLTFDRAIIDARAAFAHGQVYVALSRCRSLEGLVLSTPIKANSLYSSATIHEFTSSVEQNHPTPQVLEKARREYEQTLLLEAFDFSSLERRIRYVIQLRDQMAGNLGGTLPERIIQLQQACRTEIIDVAGRFRTQMQQLLQQEPDTEKNEALQERVKKASVYFVDRLKTQLRDPLREMSFETDNRAFEKDLAEALGRLEEDVRLALVAVEACCDGFRVRTYLKARAEAQLDQSSGRSRPERSRESRGSGEHPQFYLILKKWRQQTAEKEEMEAPRLMSQRVLLKISSALPCTLKELESIKGFGRKKTNAYGREIIGLVIAYRREKQMDIPGQALIDLASAPEVKISSREASYEMFMAGKSVNDIASLRSMAVSTIESHLAYFVGIGTLSPERLIDKHKLSRLQHYFSSAENRSLGPAKEAFGDEVSYGELRIALAYIDFLAGQGGLEVN
ncbi:MAG: helix-turn-helix domain-containing protein [Bacteroidales bacterium]